MRRSRPTPLFEIPPALYATTLIGVQRPTAAVTAASRLPTRPDRRRLGILFGLPDSRMNETPMPPRRPRAPGPRRSRAMNNHVLITGGAGFIGSHLADELLRHGYRVRALDNLSPQVHGGAARRPEYLDPEVELIEGDVRDELTVARALNGIDAVYHLAAAVGVGQSMYEIANYTSL